MESRLVTPSRLLDEWEQISKVDRHQSNSMLQNQGLVIRVMVSQNNVARATGTRLISHSHPCP
jgi:hypothetical protein